jgi:hypothetical protein
MGAQMNKNLMKKVSVADEQRKANPLDLSSDQDLTIALINLIAIEDATPDSQIGEMVRNIRKKLMARMVADENTQAQAHEYLSQAAREMNKAIQFQKTGDKKAAYEKYDATYEAYVLFLATVYGISA